MQSNQHHAELTQYPLALPRPGSHVDSAVALHHQADVEYHGQELSSMNTSSARSDRNEEQPKHLQGSRSHSGPPAFHFRTDSPAAYRKRLPASAYYQKPIQTCNQLLGLQHFYPSTQHHSNQLGSYLLGFSDCGTRLFKGLHLLTHIHEEVACSMRTATYTSACVAGNHS